LQPTSLCGENRQNEMTARDRFVPGLRPLLRDALVATLLCAALTAPGQAPAPVPTAAPTGVSAPAGGGAGDLLVAPTRVVLEGRTRAAEITLVNIGRETATYRISLFHLRMLESGEMKEIEAAEEGARWSDDLVRYAPRQVTLAPNVSQVVRIQLRLPASLPDGEYRSHLLFRAVPREDAMPERSIEKPAGADAKGFSVRLTPIYGVSIPLIVRHGATSATAALRNLTFQPARGAEPAAAACELQRAGNQSLYGNVTVTFVPPSGAPRVVGMMNGVAVYTPLAQRALHIPLQPPPGLALSGGKLEVTFSRPEQNGERLASATLPLP
jgi:P pilus assembly chaperone PapD